MAIARFPKRTSFDEIMQISLLSVHNTLVDGVIHPSGKIEFTLSRLDPKDLTVKPFGDGVVSDYAHIPAFIDGFLAGEEKGRHQMAIEVQEFVGNKFKEKYKKS